MQNYLEKIKNQWPPRITVAAVIEREQKFLIVEEQVDGEIFYNQPAGHLEAGETVIAATIRETLEETGWHVKPTAIVGIYLSENLTTGITYQRICFTGICETFDEQRPLDTDIVCTHWLSRQDLLAIERQHRSPAVLASVDDYLAGKRYPLHLFTDFRSL